MKYTEMELKVIESFRNSFNYDTLEANLNDNCTCLLAKEVAEYTGLDIKSVKGVFGSLEKKGLIFVEEFNFGEHATMVTNEGLREYYRLFETEESKEETDMIKVIERKTGTEFKAKRLDGAFEVFTMSGEPYKTLKENYFKRIFKVTGETVHDSEEESNMAEKATKKQAKPATEKRTTKAPAQEAVEELTGEKKEKMMSKIRKMLALAQNNSSEEEALSAALQAQKLMAKYNIHQDEVEWEEVKKDIDSIFVEGIEKRVLMAWRKQLALIVGENFRCKVYMHGNAVAFRGYKEDIKIAAEVYKTLYLIGDKLGGKEQARVQKETGSGKGIYNSYILGFLKGIEEGLGEQCTQLMVVVPKEVESEWEVFSAKFGTKKGKALKVIDAEAYGKGKADGKAAVKSRQVEKKGA